MDVCKALGLDWSKEKPTGHPYAAELDGQIFQHGTRLGVVELEAKNDKQIRGALLDLLTYPEGSKVLVIGSGAQCDPAKAARGIRKVLQSLTPLVGQAKVGIFTEQELEQNPRVLGEFLGLH